MSFRETEPFRGCTVEDHSSGAQLRSSHRHDLFNCTGLISAPKQGKSCWLYPLKRDNLVCGASGGSVVQLLYLHVDPSCHHPHESDGGMLLETGVDEPFPSSGVRAGGVVGTRRRRKRATRPAPGIGVGDNQWETSSKHHGPFPKHLVLRPPQIS